MTMTVSFPTNPALVTLTSSRVPARRSRSNGWRRGGPGGGGERGGGGPRPGHTTVTRAPRGALTRKSVTRAPRALSMPLMRTTGNGSSSRGGAGAGGTAVTGGGGGGGGAGGGG